MSDPLDELASAYLDREATPDEVAQVESTPAMLERVEELRQVSIRNADLDAPPPGLRETQIGRALELFDQLGAADDFDPGSSSTEPAPSGAPVTPLRRRARAPWLASAAAALVVVAGLGLAVDRLGGGNDSEATQAEGSDAGGAAESSVADLAASEAVRSEEADAFGELPEESATEGADDESVAADAAEAAPTTTPSNRSFTGADDPFDIAEAVGLTGAAPSDAAPDAELEAATRQCLDGLGFDRPTASAFIVYDGVPGLVVRTTSAPDRVIVFDRACAVLVDRPG